jgi:hypothetical protein
MSNFNKREQIGIEKGVQLSLYGSILKWLDDTCDARCPPFDGRTIEWPQTPRWVLPNENWMTHGISEDDPSEDGHRVLEERVKEAKVVQLRSLEEVLKVMDEWSLKI